MPELPEVETTIRHLRPVMLDKLILDVTVSNGGESYFNKDFGAIRDELVGRKLVNLSRIGKWMLFDFADTKAVGHLRMSGRYSIGSSIENHVHNRFQLHLEGSNVLNYIDQRRFGTFDLIKDFDQHKSLQRLGPDAFDTSLLTPNSLYTKLSNTKRPIYTTLLDQSVIAGLGNIYVNEILFLCKVHPLQPADSLNLSQVSQIIIEMRKILNMALKFKGTTLIDNLYKAPAGDNGNFAKLLNVYGKKFDSDIEVLKITGRSVFVHNSQKLVEITKD